MRAATPDLPETKWTCRGYQTVSRTLGTDLRQCGTHQNESANARKEGVQMTHLKDVEATEAIRVVKRTLREHQGA